MKILAIHADHIKIEPKKKAIPSAEEVDLVTQEIKECLVVFMAFEKPDEADPDNIVSQVVDETKKIAEQVKTKSIVLYPYAHLSSNLGSPKMAVEVMKKSGEELVKEGLAVKRAPFGWYKAFEISCKGHPLSELSRELTVTKKVVTSDQPFVMFTEKLDKKKHVTLSFIPVLATALKELYPDIEFGSCGFYHDKLYLDVTQKLKGGELNKIERKVKELLNKGFPVISGKAVNHLDKLSEVQKEIASDLGDEARVFSYGSDKDDYLVYPFNEDYVDQDSPRHFALLEVASAYWKNNSANEQFTRLFVVAFETEEELEDYDARVKEAEARDHRRIGSEMKLFSMHKEAPGMPFFHDNGVYVIRQLQNFMIDEMSKLGYEFAMTPLILNKKLWLQSGHWNHYKENMYFTKIDDVECAVKPMNCPGNILVFGNEHHSYRDLPIKLGEFGLVHRHELSGVLSGLFRVRCFTQDDAHIFCSEDQIQEQIEELIDLVDRVYSAFGFSYSMELSTKPLKAMGDPKLWDKAESALQEALKAKNKDFKINPGDGAFYGPKIDFHVNDALGRSWQCGTIQLDFSMPEKFNLSYEGSDGKKHRPVMLHRAIYGSFERFFGILIEHFAGKFPLWLSPVPVRVLTVTDRSLDFAKEVVSKIRKAGFRVQLDDRQESVGKKVSQARLDRVNYVVTIGDKEIESSTLAVRRRDGNTAFGVELSKFISQLREEFDSKR